MNRTALRRVGVRAGVVVGCLTLGALIVPGSALAAQITQVFVTNTADNPVPVSNVGTSQVTGTVNVGNFPAAPSTSTVLLLDKRMGGTGGEHSTTVDVSNYKTVRLFLGRVYGEGCPFGNTISLMIADTVTGSVLDVFEIGSVNYTNKVYEALGTNLRLSLSGPTACINDLAIWGRTN